MAKATSTAKRWTASSKYAKRSFVESEYARHLIALDEQLADHLATGHALAAILQRAREALYRGATSPELYRAASTAARLFNRDDVWAGISDASTEVEYMADILRGEVIVDPYSGDFVPKGMPYGSEAARHERLAILLRDAERAAGMTSD